MKRLAACFMLIASLMLILSVPAFANTATRMGTDVGTYGTNTYDRYNTTNDMTNNRGVRGYTGTGYDRVTTDGNYNNYNMRSVDGTTTTANRYRAAATTTNNMSWGWLGLLGLLGLIGMRGRNRETS
ncbi:WGxxGxxG family protein [Paenibacillus pinihumi]|uniref:WGxxGxxG family protein n=1 Tax=Paenibacillus pinihumi TaxID=669462 RepID=UPI0012B52E92|nr:WGxxGxxG family protein [Paenibacillus pinihumi]